MYSRQSGTSFLVKFLRSSTLMPAHPQPAFVVALLLLASGCAIARDFSDLAGAARTILGADQGVYVEAGDGGILLAQAARRPVHPASVSKVPTTLALLRRLGPDYRFTTTFSGAGALQDGTLQGDLKAARLVIEEGATFIGKSEVTSSTASSAMSKAKSHAARSGSSRCFAGKRMRNATLSQAASTMTARQAQIGSS